MINCADILLVSYEPGRYFWRGLDDPRQGYVQPLEAGSYYSVHLASLYTDTTNSVECKSRSADTVELALTVPGAAAPAAIVNTWTPITDSSWHATVPYLEGLLNCSTTAIQTAIAAAAVLGKTYVNLNLGLRITPSGGNPIVMAAHTVRMNAPSVPTTWSGSVASIYTSGSQACTIDSDYVSVVFPTALANANWTFVSLTLRWTGTPSENIVVGAVTSKTSAGFTVALSGAPSTAGLVLDWKVYA